jgi:glycosyltransferase involved in cell wall biosynthesis
VPSDTLVTIVIPTRNRASYLKLAIESVLSQDYQNIECIVIDAVSTDGTIALLESYGDRITWRSRPDRGAFDAINDGWRLGTGDVLAWVNSDDMLEAGAVRAAVEYFDTHPDVDVLYGACGAIDGDGKPLGEYPPRPWNLKRAVMDCDHIIHQISSFTRRSIIEKVGYVYPAWCHDHDLWLRIGVAGGRFGTTQKRLGLARIWPDNLGHDPGIIVEGKVGLTRRFFQNPDIPPELRTLERRAVAKAYMRCLEYIAALEPQNWRITVRIIRDAFRDDARATVVVGLPMAALFLLRRGFRAVALIAHKAGVSDTRLGTMVAGRLWAAEKAWTPANVADQDETSAGR